MELFIASFVVIGLAIAGMAAGLLCNGRSIQGSCGGLRNIFPGLKIACGACVDPGQCPRRNKRGRRRTG